MSNYPFNPRDDEPSSLREKHIHEAYELLVEAGHTDEAARLRSTPERSVQEHLADALVREHGLTPNEDGS